MKLIPKICQGENPAYEGFVVLRIPGYDEREMMHEKFGDEYADDAFADDGVDEKTAEQRLAKRSAKFIRWVARTQLEAYVSEVAITRKDDGFVFDSIAKLKQDGFMHGVVTEITVKLTERHRLAGNAPSPS